MALLRHSRLALCVALAALAGAGCQRQDAAPLAPAAPAAPAEPTAPVAPAVETAKVIEAAPWRARGNEPFWSIEYAAGELRWTTPESPEPVAWTNPTRSERADGFDVAATREGGALALSATSAICRDSMSGMPYPQTVSVRVDDREYQGCGGEAIELLAANEWTVKTLAGTAVAGRAPTLAFDAAARVAGFAGCNRWGAETFLDGEGLRLGPAFATKMACMEDGAMAQEQAFLDALSKVTAHDFDAAGHLLLKAGGETLIVAAPAAESAPEI